MLTKFKQLFAQVDMTEGRPWEKIVAFTIPMLIGNVAQQLYNTVDSIVVGKYVVGRLAEEIREEYRSAKAKEQENCWKNRKESFFADILGKAGHQRVSEFYRL